MSLAPPKRDASQATHFRSETVECDHLKETLTSHNYSLIQWKIDKDLADKRDNRYRNSQGFESASGIVVDIDSGLTMDAATEKLNTLGLNYIIITSKSHQKQKNDKPAIDRFHILIPFNKDTHSIGKYRGAFAYMNQIFPAMDRSTKDLARFFFASPEDAEYSACLDKNSLDIDAIQETYDLKEIAAKFHIINWEFDTDKTITLANGQTVPIRDIQEKQSCFCPRPEHQDKNPSAFVDYVDSQDRHMIYCMACDALGWSKNTTFEATLHESSDDFYFYGKDIMELGVSESQFFATKTARDAYYIMVDANSEKKQDAAFRYLVLNKRLANISRVDYVGDLTIDSDGYSVDKNTGVITIKISAIAEDKKDNDFIENYLKHTFGKYTGFIKKYMAMYVYTNYIQLPTLVFHGPRGSSKTTFAEMVGAIYPNLYIDWKGDVGNHTPEAEKKLAVIEENDLNAMSQYKILKKYTGQKHLLVNKKYQPEYMVRNNLNIMLLSNEAIPLYVEKTEMPSDESNNQFFVWKFPELNVKRDGNFLDKLKARLGHYIRTELKTVFDTIDKNYTRYGIPVPITEYETDLFESNVSNVEATTELAMEKIINFYEDNLNSYGNVSIHVDPFRPDPKQPITEEMELLQDGYLAFSLLQKFASHGVHPNTMIKNLMKRDILDGKTRLTKSNQKFTCYEIIDKHYRV